MIQILNEGIVDTEYNGIMTIIGLVMFVFGLFIASLLFKRAQSGKLLHDTSNYTANGASVGCFPLFIGFYLLLPFTGWLIGVNNFWIIAGILIALSVVLLILFTRVRNQNKK